MQGSMTKMVFILNCSRMAYKTVTVIPRNLLPNGSTGVYMKTMTPAPTSANTFAVFEALDCRKIRC